MAIWIGVSRECWQTEELCGSNCPQEIQNQKITKKNLSSIHKSPWAHGAEATRAQECHCHSMCEHLPL